ncbi:MAG: hypothetical protein HY841_12085 [Bacteroidetes bacterium]|nr:hypothetical protein [Bacteroidota bacterium]
MKSNLPTFNLFYPIIFLSTLMSYAFGYQILSYNSLTLCVVQIVIGLFFLYVWFIQQEEKNVIRIRAILVSIGFLVALLFLIKYPTAIILMIVLGIIFLITELKLNDKKIKDVLFNALSVFVGIILLGLLLSACFHSPMYIINGILKGKEYLPAHNADFLFHLYAEDYFDNFLKIIIYHKIMLISPIIMWLFFRFSYRKIFFISAVICFLLIANDVLVNEYYKAGMTHIYVASAFYRLIALFSIIFLVLNIIDKRARNLWLPFISNRLIFFCGLFLLFMTPIICSFGTANVPSVHITQFVFSWVLVFVFILSALFSKFLYTEYLFLIVVFLIMINMSSQIIYGNVYSPYRMNAPLTEQKFTVPELPAGNNIQFDYETSVFLKSITEKLKSHHALTKGQPIISIYNYPGLIYLLGGRSPGNALYFDTGFANYYNSGYLFDYDKSNCFFIRNSTMENLNKTVILIEQEFNVSQQLYECLNKKGICFPEKYFKADSVRIPAKKDYLFLFLPKN